MTGKANANVGKVAARHKQILSDLRRVRAARAGGRNLRPEAAGRMLTLIFKHRTMV